MARAGSWNQSAAVAPIQEVPSVNPPQGNFKEMVQLIKKGVSLLRMVCLGESLSPYGAPGAGYSPSLLLPRLY